MVLKWLREGFFLLYGSTLALRRIKELIVGYVLQVDFSGGQSLWEKRVV